MLSKQALRRNIRLLKRDADAKLLREESDRLCEKILRHERLLAAAAVIAYCPLPDEIDIFPVIQSLFDSGKRVLLPRVISDTEMVLCEYKGAASLAVGHYGIMEPTGFPVELNEIASITRNEYINSRSINEASSELSHQSAIVALVPGMAFDNDGHRLGRGKGYYDRLLVKCRPYTIGVAFSFQIVDCVPHEEHDACMDEIITG